MSARTALATWGRLGRWAAVACAVGLALLALRWSDDGFESPRADWLLDVGDGRDVARATITAVEIAGGKQEFAGEMLYRFTFRTQDGSEIVGRAVGWNPALEVGGHAPVEYLAGHPQQNRLVGMHRSLVGASGLMFQWLVLPSLLLVLLWLARAYRTYVLLRHGRAATATLVALEPPDAERTRRGCRVEFRYTDASGREHTARQRVGPRTPLADALAGAAIGAPLTAAFAVHGLVHPQLCHLVAVAETGEARA